MSRAQERSTAIRAERVPTFSNPWGLLAMTSTSGTGPKTFFMALPFAPYSPWPLQRMNAGASRTPTSAYAGRLVKKK
jgi:hypothetical protein